MSYTDMEYIFHGKRRYHYPPLYEEIKYEQVMATRDMFSFFNGSTNNIDIHSKSISTNLCMFLDTNDDNFVYQADHVRKRKIARPYLSLAKSYNAKINKKSFFGAPNPLFVTEDIILNNSLDDLKVKFYDIIGTF